MLSGGGSQPVLLSATSAAKATANHGSSGGRWPPTALPVARVNITANRITGSSAATRISLTSVAVSPVACDMP
ncbi:hypothetical protein D3C72_1851110 [compost metagenome]